MGGPGAGPGRIRGTGMPRFHRPGETGAAAGGIPVFGQRG
jgi:hypothetical protein